MSADNPFEEWTRWSDKQLANWLVNNQINVSFPAEFWAGEQAQTGTCYAIRGKDTNIKIDMTFYNNEKVRLERGPIPVSNGFHSIRAALKRMGPKGIYLSLIHI